MCIKWPSDRFPLREILSPGQSPILSEGNIHVVLF